MRPENGGETLSLFRRGRVRSSSRAELREEVPEPCVLEGCQPQGPSQTRCGHLPDLASAALMWVNHCQMTVKKRG